MEPRNCHLSLVCQSADEVEVRAASDQRAGLGLNEQLGNMSRLQPFSVASHDRSDVGRLALDGDLSNPRQGWSSRFADLGERSAILRHLLAGKGAKDGSRQDVLDEEVVSQDQRLTGFGTQRLQEWTHSDSVPVVPGLRPHDRLHICDALQCLTVAVGPIEAEGRAPVMDDKGDPLVHMEGLEQGVEVAAMLDEAIGAGTTVTQLIGVTHAY